MCQKQQHRLNRCYCTQPPAKMVVCHRVLRLTAAQHSHAAERTEPYCMATAGTAPCVKLFVTDRCTAPRAVAWQHHQSNAVLVGHSIHAQLAGVHSPRPGQLRLRADLQSWLKHAYILLPSSPMCLWLCSGCTASTLSPVQHYFRSSQSSQSTHQPAAQAIRAATIRHEPNTITLKSTTHTAETLKYSQCLVRPEAPAASC
jgi:hypothetical protein